MSRRVDVDALFNTIMSELEAYKYGAFAAVGEAVEMTAKQTVKELKQTSPKRTGKYAKTWKYGRVDTARGSAKWHTFIYNKDNYRLTHLLENGHATRNGGRTKEQVHIAKADELAAEIMRENLIQILSDATAP